MLREKEIKEGRTPITDECKEDESARIEDIHSRLVVEGLLACGHIGEDGFCGVYLWPEKKWSNKVCPMSPLSSAHMIARSVKDEQKVNPIKMSKRKIIQ